jgi:AraC-like DNA-binding protein
MAAKKLTNQDCKRIVELINQGHQIKDLAKIYGVHRSCISRRCKAMYKSKRTPIEIKNKVIKAIKEGHAKDADYYYRKIPFEWFKSVLKFHPKKVEEENTLKSLKAKNTLVATGTSPRKKDAVCRTRTGDRSVNSRVLHQLS